MTAFFICIVMIGIIMVAVAMIWMVIEKKANRDYRLEIDEKRYELQNLIEDAEQLLDELNNFSGYIVTRMEEKQQEIEEVVKSVDGNMALFTSIIEKSELVIRDTERLKVKDKAEIDTKKKAKTKIKSEVKNALMDEAQNEAPSKSLLSKKGKVIPIDAKRREVISLSRNGINNTEIAKLLNMGKGEIELITRISQIQ